MGKINALYLAIISWLLFVIDYVIFYYFKYIPLTICIILMFVSFFMAGIAATKGINEFSKNKKQIKPIVTIILGIVVLMFLLTSFDNTELGNYLSHNSKDYHITTYDHVKYDVQIGNTNIKF